MSSTSAKSGAMGSGAVRPRRTAPDIEGPPEGAAADDPGVAEPSRTGTAARSACGGESGSSTGSAKSGSAKSGPAGSDTAGSDTDPR